MLLLRFEIWEKTFSYYVCVCDAGTGQVHGVF